MNKYSLGLIELYNENLHGLNKKISNHFLLSKKVKLNEFYNNEYVCELENMKSNYYENIESLNINVNEIEKYFKIKLVCYGKLKTGEYICIDKTHNISLLKRMWKKKYYERLRLAKIRSHPKHLYYRRATGRWLV